ncbi:MAG: TIM barrel protein [Verrucomicrobiota bacterium]
MSISCFEDRSPAGICQNALKYPGVEFTFMRSSHDGAVQCLRDVASSGVPVLLHNYFPPPDKPFVLNLASLDPEIRKCSIELCCEAMQLTAELGGKIFGAHAGFCSDLDPAILGKPEIQGQLDVSQFGDREQALEVFCASVLELVRFGKSMGVDFMIENHVVAAESGQAGKEWLLLVESDEFHHLHRYLRNQGHQLHVLLDTGHLNVTASTCGFSRESFYDEVEPYIHAFHLSDNNGLKDQHLPFNSNAWFLDRVRQSERPVTLEFHPVSEAVIHESLEVLHA